MLAFGTAEAAGPEVGALDVAGILRRGLPS